MDDEPTLEFLQSLEVELKEMEAADPLLAERGRRVKEVWAEIQARRRGDRPN